MAAAGTGASNENISSLDRQLDQSDTRGASSSISEESAPSDSKGSAPSKWRAIKAEISLLLHFSMLAACTIGPGTVVTCSKSGADFGLDLICEK